MIRDLAAAFVRGAKETPRGYFAPAVAVWRLLVAVTDSLVTKEPSSKTKGDAVKARLAGH